MYRYDIGDILEVVGMYNNTPSVKFSRKVGQACNVVGELMNVNHVNAALDHTFKHFGFNSPFYCMLPVQEGFTHYYTLMIELPEEITEL